MEKFWNTDKIVSISAILIGVGSLVVVTYQTELIQREQRTSVMPYLEFESRTPTANRTEVYLVNSGLGPALVKEVRVHFDGATYPVDLFGYFLNNYELTDGAYTFNRVFVGDLISADQNMTLISSDPNDPAFSKFLERLNRGEINFEIIYESLYGEPWLSSIIKNAPIRLEDED